MKEPISHILYRTFGRACFALDERLFRRLRQDGFPPEGEAGRERGGGCRFFAPYPYRVGIVCDEFVYENYRDTCRLIYLRPDWRESPFPSMDLLLVVSPWQGVDRAWAGVSQSGSPASQALLALMGEGRRRGIPTVFYSKEDPPNYEIFLPFAREADVVFTSAEECVSAYRRRCGHQRVYPLTFGVNPLLNNPIGMGPVRRRGEILFAGSWMKKYPQRIRDQGQLFRWVEEAGLSLRILDRNQGRRDWAYRYPLRWQKYVLPPVSYQDLPALCKRYEWVLNLNSVTDSATMFSMRVYDALACGCLVLSNGSLGMERLLPEALVIRSQEDLKAALSLSQEDRAALRWAGIRRVMGENTVFHRMAELLDRAGLTCRPPRRTVAVLARGTGPELETLAAQFQAQTYPDKIFLTDLREEPSDAVALWKGGGRYDPFFLQDRMDAFKYTDCDFVTAGPGPAAPDGHCGFADRTEDPYSTVFWGRTPEGAEKGLRLW